MTGKEIEAAFISVPQIMAETGGHRNTVYYWLRFMQCETVFGRPLIPREEFERFKREHPELIKAPVSA